ncbi:hypothetical protein M9H77_30059 [Catharanthus roseus]|uniref:Uncharacterized protein n=1 Tax=Catharanthus roseus TaxID=4058 RepID=A0ACB9ZW51_CATRO|nr:hypothetical protein M9H77_30059 [Catharanthus roseus]
MIERRLMDSGDIVGVEDRSMEEDLGPILEDLSISLSLNPPSLCYEVSLEELKSLLDSYTFQEFSPTYLYHNINGRKEIYHIGVRRPRRKCWRKTNIMLWRFDNEFFFKPIPLLPCVSFKELKLFLELNAFCVILVGNFMVNHFTCELVHNIDHILKYSSPCAFLEKQLWVSIARIKPSYHDLELLHDNFLFDRLNANVSTSCASMWSKICIFLRTFVENGYMERVCCFLWTFCGDFHAKFKGEFVENCDYESSFLYASKKSLDGFIPSIELLCLVRYKFEFPHEKKRKKMNGILKVFKAHLCDLVETTFGQGIFELNLKNLVDKHLVYSSAFVDFVFKYEALNKKIVQNTKSCVKIENQSLGATLLYFLTFKEFLDELIFKRELKVLQILMLKQESALLNSFLKFFWKHQNFLFYYLLFKDLFWRHDLAKEQVSTSEYFYGSYWESKLLQFLSSFIIVIHKTLETSSLVLLNHARKPFSFSRLLPFFSSHIRRIDIRRVIGAPVEHHRILNIDYSLSQEHSTESSTPTGTGRNTYRIPSSFLGTCLPTTNDRLRPTVCSRSLVTAALPFSAPIVDGRLPCHLHLQCLGNIHSIIPFNDFISNVARLLWLFEGLDSRTIPFKGGVDGMTRDRHENMESFQGSVMRSRAWDIEEETQRNKFGRS